MNHEAFEHVLRAAATICGEDELIVVGSPAILGSFLDPPEDLLVSIEVDLYPRHRPELADLIDGSIGEGSPFRETFGYYAHGVGPTTAVLPAGWELRLVPFSTVATRGAVGLCVELHDLLLSKYAAGRPKDLSHRQVVADAHIADPAVLIERTGLLPLDRAHQDLVRHRISRDYSSRRATRSLTAG